MCHSGGLTAQKALAWMGALRLVKINCNLSVVATRDTVFEQQSLFNRVWSGFMQLFQKVNVCLILYSAEVFFHCLKLIDFDKTIIWCYILLETIMFHIVEIDNYSLFSVRTRKQTQILDRLREIKITIIEV